MIEGWKVRREIGRLRDRFASWIGNLYEPYQRRRHDRWRAAQPVPSDLGVALTGKVAIFLIYQPKGVAPSILTTLRWLVANGYSPFVIANTPISEGDRPGLAALSWRILERPNFGYDFGGYRDGVLLLNNWNIKVDRLLILNDSVWMPTRADSTLIARLEAAGADLAGGTLHVASIRRNGTTRPRYLESYLYLLRGQVLNNEGFVRFWQKFPSSSHKENAVRKGERRFTETVAGLGFSIAGLFSMQQFLDGMAACDDNTLCLSLMYGGYIDATHVAESEAIVAAFQSDKDWRARALDFMKRMVHRRRFNAVFPYPCDKIFGMDFLKKSIGSTGEGGKSLHVEMREGMLSAVAAGDLPELLPEVKAEMLRNRRQVSREPTLT